MELPMPRLPHAFARHQEAYPLSPYKKDPLPQILSRVITLRNMCCKWWLERVQYVLRRDITKSKLFALHRFLADLPREVRSYMIHNTLKTGGLHLSHGLKEIPSINRALVLLSSEVQVKETVFLTLPKPSEVNDWPPDLELICRSGEGVRKMVLTLNPHFNSSIKKIMADLCRTCSHMTHVTIHEATDDAVAVITRHCQSLLHLDVSGSQAVTDEGVSRAVVNLKWPDEKNCRLKCFDIGKTSITQDSILQLLTRLPSLTSMGSADVVECLEMVVELFGPESIKVSLEEVTLKCATVGRMQSIMKYCPKVTSIKIIYSQHAGATLNDLRLLKELSHVDVVVREPFLLSQRNLQDLVWAIGPKLQTLKVSGDVYWEADLGILVGHCPSLQVVSIPAVTFPTKESLSVFTTKGTPVLRNLTELVIDCMTGIGPKAWAKDFNLSRRGLVLALRLCLKLRRLVLRPTILVDTDFIDVLAENRLEYLEVLELYNSCLGLTCSKLVIDTCQNLHIMKGLKTWRGMTLHDLVFLRKHARGHRRASDLKIVP